LTFQKGQSGNPAGRPKSEPTITPWLKRLLADKRDGKTRAEHVAEQLVSMAESGDQLAIKTLLERIDGKVLEQIDLSVRGEIVKAIDADAWGAV
jgi:Mg/Co/Ni transporter MgtE